MDPPKFVSLGDRVAGPSGTPRRVRSDRSPPVGQAVRIAASVASRTSTVRLVIVLGAVNAIGPLSIDMYLPGFPDIAAGLHTNASQGQLTLTARVAGLAPGQVVIGPLRAHRRRRRARARPAGDRPPERPPRPPRAAARGGDALLGGVLAVLRRAERRR